MSDAPAGLTRLDTIARLGFVARGLLYVLFGWIALNTRQRADEGQSAVFDWLGKLPGGSVLLLAALVGLSAYGVFRLACGAFDLEGKGSTLKGWAGRIAQLASGVIHLAFAGSAGMFLTGMRKTHDHAGDQNTRAAAGTLLDLPLGGWALDLIALGLVAAAGLQLRKAYTASHMKQCASDTPEIACTLGRIGLVTRAAVFTIVALSFVRAGRTERSADAHSVGGALESLRGHDVLYVAVALGLIVFGLFSLMLARYRVVPKVDVVDATKAKLNAV